MLSIATVELLRQPHRCDIMFDLPKGITVEQDIDVKEGDASLVFSDKGTSVNYMLADLSVIPVV